MKEREREREGERDRDEQVKQSVCKLEKQVEKNLRLYFVEDNKQTNKQTNTQTKRNVIFLKC
jgi:hypothetical protein